MDDDGSVYHELHVTDLNGNSVPFVTGDVNDPSDGEVPVRLTHSNPFLSDREFARQEVITYKARDGLELEAILIHPAKRERGGFDADTEAALLKKWHAEKG